MAFPGHNSLGLIEAYEHGPIHEMTRRPFRGITASASLKLADGRPLWQPDLPFPGHNSLGLIEATRRRSASSLALASLSGA